MPKLSAKTVYLGSLALITALSFALPVFAENINRKLKILMVTTTFPKISETFVINQVTGLLARGHDVYVFAEKKEAAQKVHEDVTKYDLVKRTYYETLPADLDSYDVVICQFGPLGKKFLAEKKARGITAKLVTFFRGFDVSRYLKNKENPYEELFQEGDLFLPNCEYFKKRILSLGAPAEKTLVHYSSIDCSRFKMRTAPLDDDFLYLVTTGRLVEKKGIDDALRALPQVIKKHPNVQYIVIGDGAPRVKKKLQDLCHELELEDYVTFAGWRTQAEVAHYLSKAHIFLLPCVTASDGDEDAIPNVLKEAMACGVPVISTSITGIPEIIIDGYNGLLVNEHDFDALAKKVDYLLTQPELCKTFAQRGRQVVEEKFEISKKADELEKILLDLMKQEGN